MRPIRNSAKAIIIRAGRLLVITAEDEDGPWYLLPGGGQEPGETLHEALIRECHEEIGAAVTPGPLVHIREYIGMHHEFASEDPDAHQAEFMFRCAIPDDYEPLGVLPSDAIELRARAGPDTVQGADKRAQLFANRAAGV